MPLNLVIMHMYMEKQLWLGTYVKHVFNKLYIFRSYFIISKITPIVIIIIITT